MTAIEFFDLETLRLAHFHAIRRVNDSFGMLDHYYVIGQPVWPRRSRSIALLARLGYVRARELGGIESDMELTEAGEQLYGEFARREESGELKRDMARLQEKRMADLEQAVADFHKFLEEGKNVGEEDF